MGADLARYVAFTQRLVAWEDGMQDAKDWRKIIAEARELAKGPLAVEDSVTRLAALRSLALDAPEDPTSDEGEEEYMSATAREFYRYARAMLVTP